MTIKHNIKHIYEKKYKLLLIIPISLLILAIFFNVLHFVDTGNVINKGVSLGGGTSITVYKDVNIDNVKTQLYKVYSKSDIDLKTISGTKGFIIEASNNINSDDLLSKIESITGKLKDNDYTLEKTGATLGRTFFKEIFRSILVAFLFMGFVVFLYFGENTGVKITSLILTIIASILLIFIKNKSTTTDIISIIITFILLVLYFKNSPPSLAVIMSAFTDIVVTLAVVNIAGIKLSTAGIAAFLMLIGYSVDTDILLTTRLLKRKEGTMHQRTYNAMKTGLTMTFTTMTAVVIAYFVSPADSIKQIMLIVFIGLVTDIITTWIQTSGLVRMYLERKQKRAGN